MRQMHKEAKADERRIWKEAEKLMESEGDGEE